MEKSIKLVEVTDQPWPNRWRPLVEILKNHQIDLQSDIKTVTDENFESVIKEILKGDADICRISDKYISRVMQILPNTTHNSLFLGAAGFLMRDGKVWWPRPLLDEAFARNVSDHIGQVDLNSHALVVGGGGASQLLIGALSKIGYSTINLTEKSEEAGTKIINNLRSKIFQVKFNFVPFQEITTLPGIHSIVINTMPLDLENVVLDELYFFNFLKSNGVVIDLTLLPAKTPLIMEAEQWGARHMSGDYIAAERDILMIEMVAKLKIDKEKYRTALRAEIDAVPFDPSPFLKRFRERGS